MFNTDIAEDACDIEQLIIDTAWQAPLNPRLFACALNWLAVYQRLVCRHRLAAFAAGLDDATISATLGLMLEFVKERTGTDHFNLVLKECKPLEQPIPLFIIDRQSDKFANLSRFKSDSIAIKWGLWCDKPKFQTDMLRPQSWIWVNNPNLAQRAVFNGNLKASILETLRFNSNAGESESMLARYCNATRKAVREALDHLEFCRMIRRKVIAEKVSIEIAT
jgi:hypothetical protein